MKKAYTFLILMSCTFIAPVLAGWNRISGSEAELWAEGGYNVVVGTLSGIKASTEKGRHAAIFVPKATIAGTFDCGAHETLPVTFYAQTPGSAWASTSITKLPPEDTPILAVMRYSPKGEDSPMDSGFIVSDLCAFMPGESALVVIKGLDDPLVAETLKKIQKARSPHKTSATHPATAPVRRVPWPRS